MKQENSVGGRPGLIGRRDLIAMVGGAAVAWPLAARAQERALPLIGFLNGGAADRSTGFLVGVPRGLNEMGFVEGRNFAAEYRWADDHPDRLPALAADLVLRRVAVIVTGGGPQPALAAKAATSTIPIVFFTGDDPVKFGLVPRYNRPGGNLTGFDFMISELEGKRIGLLHELVPTAGVVAALCDPHGSGAAAILAEVAGAAKSLGLELVTVNASDSAQFDAAFAQAVHAGAGAMLVTAVELFTVSRANRDLLVELEAKHRLPTMFSLSETTKTGGLISYSADPVDGYRQVGIYVGRILKGENPGDLPIMRPTKFTLAINLKTAEVLGITVPPILLAMADEVIE
ncbi:MAG: ABC transporter substrate-binding protein [Acetobacteraceae bacterium]|nr:ABC transporter substrate-binding protein [Acetobacteraceae bacterium]